MANDFITNINLNPNNSLTHLINDISIFDDNEPTILNDSLYYDNNTFVKCKDIKNSKFLLLSLNCQSFNANKFDQLLFFLNHLNNYDVCANIIALQEVWFSEGFDSIAYQITDYELIAMPSKCSKHGGLIIYIHKSFSHSVKHFEHTSSIWDSVFVNIVHLKTNRNFLIGNIYRPPHKHIEHLNIFITEFSDILQTISTNKTTKCFVTGDTNIDLLKIHQNTHNELFFNNIISAAFKPLITLPTRLSTRNSLIDNVFSNATDLFSGVLSSHISDHQMYFTSSTLDNSFKNHLPKFIQKPFSMDICLNRFRIEVEHSINNDIFNTSVEKSPTEKYDILEKLLVNCHKTAFITRTVQFNKKKHHIKDWMTQSILKSVNYKNKLYKNLVLNKSNAIYANLKINFNTYQNILKNVIKVRKKIFILSFFISIKMT